MDRRNLPFNSLRAFEAAARHASVSGAARELGVTHSAISHQIKQLEQLLGVALFVRTNRGLQITVDGEMLRPVVGESFDIIGSTLDSIRNVDQASVIQVTSTPTFATKWLVPRLSAWYGDGGKYRIHLRPSLEFLDFDRDGIDLAIRCGVPPWTGLEHELLMPIHLVPVCSPAYAQAHGLLKRPVDALQHDLIHADVGDHGLGEEWIDWLTGVNVGTPPELQGISMHDPALAMQAAADGLGLAIGYRELIDQDLKSARLVTASKKLVKHDYSYYLVYRKTTTSSAAIKQFKDWLISQL